MAHARRSLRNHHGKPHEHAPGDPFGVYLPPLSEWRVTETGAREWVHPRLGWLFRVMKHSGNVFTDGDARNVVDGPDYSGPDAYGGVVFRGSPRKPVYDQIKAWYASQTPATIMRLHEARKYGSERQFAIVDLDRYAGVVDTGHRYYDVSGKGALAQYVAEERPSELVRNARFAVPARRSERNPDWSAIRAKASHYGSRAATGAREAYAWTAPRAKRAAEVTWEGAKSAGRAVKRGAKRAAPVVARGARSAAEGLDRWSQTNGRCAMRNGAVLPPPKTSNFHVNGMHFRVVSMDYPDGGHATTVTVWESRPGSSHRHPHLALRDLHKSMGGREAGNSIVWGRAIDEKRLREVAEKVTR